MVGAVYLSLRAKVSMDVATQLNIIVAIDAHDLLDDVRWAGDVDTIARHT